MKNRLVEYERQKAKFEKDSLVPVDPLLEEEFGKKPEPKPEPKPMPKEEKPKPKKEKK